MNLLLTSQEPEHIIVGLNHLVRELKKESFFKTHDSEDVENILQTVLKRIHPSFVIQMLQTKLENSKIIDDIAYEFLGLCLNYSKVLIYFEKYLPNLIEILISKLYILESGDDSSRQVLTKLIFEISLNKNEHLQVIELLISKTPLLNNIINILEYLQIISSFVKTSSSQPILLNQTSMKLRLLLVKAFHLSSEEKFRYQLFELALTILRHLSPNWLSPSEDVSDAKVAGAQYRTLESSNNASKAEEKASSVDTFSRILCSALYAEIRLLSEKILESIAFLENEPNLRVSDEDRVHPLPSRDDVLKPTVLDINNLFRVFLQCIEIFDMCLVFLIGEGQKDHDEDSAGVWTNLAPSSLYAIKEDLYLVIEELFDFAACIGQKPVIIQGLGLGDEFRFLMRKISSTLGRWCLEDQSLMSFLYKPSVFSSFLAYSVIPGSLPVSEVERLGLWREICASDSSLGHYFNSSVTTTNESETLEPGTDVDSYRSHTSRAPDCLITLLPCLVKYLRVSDEDEEGGNDENLGGDFIFEKIMEEDAKALIIRLIILLSCSIDKLDELIPRESRFLHRLFSSCYGSSIILKEVLTPRDGGELGFMYDLAISSTAGLKYLNECIGRKMEFIRSLLGRQPSTRVDEDVVDFLLNLKYLYDMNVPS